MSSGKQYFPFKLALRLALGVSVGLLLLGIALFFPSYQRYEAALYDRLEHVAWAEASAVLRAAGFSGGQNNPDLDSTVPYPGALLKGLTVFSSDGQEFANMGEPVHMAFSPVDTIQRIKLKDQQRYEICWNPEISQTPFHFIARMDSAWIDKELSVYAKETAQRTLFMSLFAAALILTLMSRTVLRPIIAFRKVINLAAHDPERAVDQGLDIKAAGEIEGVSRDLNELLLTTAAGKLQLEDQRRLALDSEEKFGAIFRASHLAIFLIDPRTEQIIEANDAAHRLLGAEGTSLISHQMEEFHPNEMPELRDFVAKVMSGEEYKTDQLTCTTCDGRVLPAEFYASRVELGGSEYLMIVVRDLTESREYENRLMQARDAAELADHAKTEFLANMSHELRTPLNAIIGYAEIIAGDLLGRERRDEYNEFGEHIRASGAHLLNIINDILDIAKIETGEATLREEFIDPDELIEKCRVFMKNKIEEAGIELEITSELPRLRLWCDETKMRQIMLNLLSNAIKFTPAGGQIKMSTGLDQNGDLYLTVVDTGVGIPEDKIDFVFEPFNQVGDHQTRATQGTGLGLPIARSLAELHGGSLKLESTVGKGTRLIFCLPKSRIEIAAGVNMA